MSKPTVVFPTVFEQKVILNENPQGNAAWIELVTPSFVKPNETFSLNVSVLSAEGYVASNFGEALTIEGVTIQFTEGQPAVARIQGLSLSEEGFKRYSVKWNNQEFFSNPISCKSTHLHRIYWGDPHIHTNLSNCHPEKCRSLNYAFIAARHVTGLDWASAADHVSNGRCEFAKWKEQVAVSNAFNDAGTFVTLPAFEASFKGNCGGDNNFYMAEFPAMYVDDYAEGTVKTAIDKLAETMDRADFFAVPHHTTRTGKHGEIPAENYGGVDMTPVMEIHSKWGTSEYRGNTLALQKVHPGPSYAQDFLAQGYKFGFVGGTDTHSSMTTAYELNQNLHAPCGMTAVLVDSLTRRNVFDAIKTRNCYAVCKDRIIFDGSVNDVRFGSEIVANHVKIDVAIAAKSKIEKITLVRNGEDACVMTPRDWKATFTFEEDVPFEKGETIYYYLRVECDNQSKAWTSPVWLSAAQPQ